MAFDSPPAPRPLWAEFDAEWYLRSYAVHLIGVERTTAAIEAFYYASGARLGHSPNRYFDERWYLKGNPDVARALAEGGFSSGFEHYGLNGHKGRSPHWLFCERHYLAEYVDLTADALKAGNYANGYDHYLRTGDREFRSGHWLFNPAMHRTATIADPATQPRSGEFRRFLSGDRRAGSTARLSWYFDPVWYLATYPDVAAAIESGLWSCALEHYLCNDQPAAFDPNADFSEAYYRSVHLDVVPQLADGSIRNCFEHFLRFGAAERRKPHPDVDLHEYFRAVSVQTDIEQGLFPDAFAHFEFDRRTRAPARRRPSAVAGR